MAMGLGGVALLSLFSWIELRVAKPLIRLSLFRSRVFSGATLSAAANYIALFVPIILLPFYLREGRALSPGATGLLLSTQPLVMALVAALAGWLSDRIGTRILATGGMVLLAAGLAGLATIGDETSVVTIGLWLALMGLGTGIFISPNSSALMGAAPRTGQGVAGGVLAVARNLGMMLGVAAAVTIFAEAGGQTGREWTSGEFAALRVAFAAAAGVSVLGALASSLRGRLEG
jgi:MFS family permease